MSARVPKAWRQLVLLTMVLAGCGGQISTPTEAGPTPPDAAEGADAAPDALERCRAACQEPRIGRCDQDGTCEILCAGANDCFREVRCPVGIPCRVECSGLDSCRDLISCEGSTGCTVTCSGNWSCRRILCSGPECDIRCTGIGSCERSVECRDASKCSIACTANGACRGEPQGEVRCVGGDRCDITCNRGCQDVYCSAATCSVSCSAGCDVVTCENGDTCNVACSGGSCLQPTCCRHKTCNLSGTTNGC